MGWRGSESRQFPSEIDVFRSFGFEHSSPIRLLLLYINRLSVRVLSAVFMYPISSFDSQKMKIF